MSVGAKIKKIVGTALFVLVVLFVLFAAVVGTINRARNKPTFLFGHALLWVETGSMEPSIPSRSYVLVREYLGESLETGTVITFTCTDPSSAVYGETITHRIVEVTTEGYRTKGDNGNPDTWTVKSQDVVAVYVTNLSVLTAIGRIFASPIGLLLIVGVFLASCVFLYIPDIVKAFQSTADDRTDKEKELEIERRVREEVRKLQEEDRRQGK